MADQRSNRRGGPMARQLAKTLKAYIFKHCSAGDRLPPERELARRYKRSVTTVRGALGFLAAEGFVERKIGSGTYVTGVWAQRIGATALIYFGTPTSLLTTPWTCQVYWRILDVAIAQQRRIHLVFGLRQRPCEVTEDLAQQIDLNLVDSVICLEVFSRDLLERLGSQVPTVSIDYPCYVRGVSSCALDHRENVAEAVDHLWRVGHRRIALVGNVNPRQPDPAVGARCSAFQRAILARDLPFRGEWVMPFRSASDAERMVHEWLATAPDQRPTACLCLDYLWRIAEVAVTSGVQLPAQLSLMGIGENPTWTGSLETEQIRQAKQTWSSDMQGAIRGERTNWLDPRFEVLRNMQATRMALPFVEMGQWAAEEIARRLGEPDAPPQHELFRGNVSPGNSVAPPASQ